MFAILCRSSGAAPGFGYGSYKDFAPTELGRLQHMLATICGPRPVGAVHPSNDGCYFHKRLLWFLAALGESGQNLF
jgi:hypothetical protein